MYHLWGVKTQRYHGDSCSSLCTTYGELKHKYIMVTAVAHYIPLIGELKHKDIMATAAVDLVLQLT